VSQTYVLPTPATTPNALQSGFSSSEIPPLPLPSSQRYVHPQHLLKGRFIPIGAIPLGSKPKDFEPLEEVSDSETDADEGLARKTAPTTGSTRRRGMEVGVSPPVSPAKKRTVTPVATVKILRKRKQEPVIGEEGKAPKRRKIKL
jgi:hypothetical protein